MPTNRLAYCWLTGQSSPTCCVPLTINGPFTATDGLDSLPSGTSGTSSAGPNSDLASGHGSSSRVGDEVGWRRDGMWLAWAGIYPSTFWPTLDPGEIAPNVPAGCLPFHDIISNGRWEREFSPRDCWGEQVW